MLLVLMNRFNNINTPKTFVMNILIWVISILIFEFIIRLYNKFHITNKKSIALTQIKIFITSVFGIFMLNLKNSTKRQNVVGLTDMEWQRLYILFQTGIVLREVPVVQFLTPHSHTAIPRATTTLQVFGGRYRMVWTPPRQRHQLTISSISISVLAVVQLFLSPTQDRFVIFHFKCEQVKTSWICQSFVLFGCVKSCISVFHVFQVVLFIAVVFTKYENLWIIVLLGIFMILKHKNKLNRKNYSYCSCKIILNWETNKTGDKNSFVEVLMEE